MWCYILDEHISAESHEWRECIITYVLSIITYVLCIKYYITYVLCIIYVLRPPETEYNHKSFFLWVFQSK